MKTRIPLLGTALVLASSAVFAQSQGVSKDEIVLGSIQDLSGPIAGFGKQVRLGAYDAGGQHQRGAEEGNSGF
ncbi:MAG: hypothetical protein KUA38_09615, partial [Hydrogenophaga sp.]|nr:hypothetical protein [Hydrogenophaga sp.]